MKSPPLPGNVALPTPPLYPNAGKVALPNPLGGVGRVTLG